MAKISDWFHKLLFSADADSKRSDIDTNIEKLAGAVAANGALNVADLGSTIADHSQIVGGTAAGSVTAIAAAKGVMLKALKGNAAAVPFGIAAHKYDQLDAGERVFIRINNPSLICHDMSGLAGTDKLIVTVIQ